MTAVGVTCQKCGKQLNSEQALRMHNIRVHTLAGRRGAKMGAANAVLANTGRKRHLLNGARGPEAQSNGRPNFAEFLRGLQAQGITGIPERAEKLAAAFKLEYVQARQSVYAFDSGERRRLGTGNTKLPQIQQHATGAKPGYREFARTLPSEMPVAERAQLVADKYGVKYKNARMTIYAVDKDRREGKIPREPKTPAAPQTVPFSLPVVQSTTIIDAHPHTPDPRAVVCCPKCGENVEIWETVGRFIRAAQGNSAMLTKALNVLSKIGI